MPPLQLPDWYEDFLVQSLKIDLRDKKTLNALAAPLLQIKEGLTKKNQRPGFIKASYLKNETIRKAYAIYYMTNNLLKVNTPLREIKRSGFFEERKELAVLEIGSGPGTGIFGSLLWLSENTDIKKLHLTASDNVDQNLELFQTLKGPFARAVKGRVQPSLFSHRLDIEHVNSFHSAPLDIITALNVVNEISPRGENNLLDLLKASLSHEGFAILIDPALHGTSRKLLMFRNLLVSEGFSVYSPCLADTPCQALNHPKDWCHTDVDWERPSFIKELDERVGNIHKSLKFSYLVVSKSGKRLSDSLLPALRSTAYRAVSELMHEKGKSRVFLCNEGGRRLFVRQKKHKSDTNRDFDNLKRYDLVSIDAHEAGQICSIFSLNHTCFHRVFRHA